MLSTSYPLSLTFDYMVKDRVNGHNLLNNPNIEEVNEEVQGHVCTYYNRCRFMVERNFSKSIITGLKFHELQAVKWQKHVYDIVERD